MVVYCPESGCKWVSKDAPIFEGWRAEKELVAHMRRKHRAEYRERLTKRLDQSRRAAQRLKVKIDAIKAELARVAAPKRRSQRSRC